MYIIASKIYPASTDAWHAGCHAGLLQVKPRPGGKLHFIEFGRWQQFRKSQLSYGTGYYAHCWPVGKVYDESGRITDLLLLVNGATLVETRAI